MFQIIVTKKYLGQLVNGFLVDIGLTDFRD